MFNSGIIASRHRIPQYLLNLNNVNNDYLSIDALEKVYNVPLTGDYEIGLEVTLPSSFTTSMGLIGYGVFANVLNRWGLLIRSNGQIAFNVSSNVFLGVNLSDYFGQKVMIRCGYYDASPTRRLYIDDVLVASGNSGSRPSAPTANQKMFIGVYGDPLGENPQPNTFLNGSVHSFFIDDDVFDVNEGVGFPTFSQMGTEATGFTSNAGGLTYWNSNVWQLV